MIDCCRDTHLQKGETINEKNPGEKMSEKNWELLGYWTSLKTWEDCFLSPAIPGLHIHNAARLILVQVCVSIPGLLNSPQWTAVIKRVSAIDVKLIRSRRLVACLVGDFLYRFINQTHYLSLGCEIPWNNKTECLRVFISRTEKICK